VFKRIKHALGLLPTFEKWEEMKSVGLSNLLGKEHDTVMHSIIPFMVGGGLDLYYFPQKQGFAVATKELIDESGRGPHNRDFSAFELCMFSRVDFNLASADNLESPMGRAHQRIKATLNVLAKYASDASLNVNDTLEFPLDFDPELGGQCFIISALTKDGKSLKIGKKEFGLMVAINIHRSEMESARQHGGSDLIAKLESHGHYPYSDLDRTSVV
jgi:Suppressor of fused protein (SUFU)